MPASPEPLDPGAPPLSLPQHHDEMSGVSGRSPSQQGSETLPVAAVPRTLSDAAADHVTRAVSVCCTPQQILIVMRLLKAVTFCFLILNVAADIMVLCFLGLGSAGGASGVREFVIRLYGMGLSGVAVALELDVGSITDGFRGLKGYVARALLLLLISIITQNKGNYPNDDQGSVIVFQFVTSLVILICALVYFVLGMLCCDRFTSRLFLQSKDPTISTAIPRSLVRTEETAFHSV